MFTIRLKKENQSPGLAIEGPDSLNAQSPHDFLAKFRNFLDDFDHLKFINHIQFQPPAHAEPDELARWKAYEAAGQLALKSFQETLGGSSDTLLGLKNICANLPTILAKPSSDLIRVSRAFDAVVISAGPSLDLEWETLREIQDRTLLIACDAVLKSCLERGIRPHLVCSNERRVMTLPFFKDLPSDLKTILVGQATLKSQVFEIYPGPQTTAFKLQSHFQWLGLDRKLHWVAGSVAHLCFQMATSLGARSIALVGQDLAFHPESLQTHGAVSAYPEWSAAQSAETIAQKDALLLVEGNTRETVPTKMLWNTMAYQYDDLIRASKIPTFNTSVLGRRLYAAPFMTLKDWSSRLSPEGLQVFVPPANPFYFDETRIVQTKIAQSLIDLAQIESQISGGNSPSETYRSLMGNLTFLELIIEICIRELINAEGQAWAHPESAERAHEDFLQSCRPWIAAVRQTLAAISLRGVDARRVEN